ncbi:hypothetical protein acsn021_39160 [Anaerocolumna cellulosilytica]|uniref:Uncharacterized protein n=1 Tax=Anaerocolumna cellulosilytica TaxID=433286 RepID=A0A6S6R8E8_9FIRM|nr:hypothetical protein [Anaerocolumna cellulosilytica]MBB5196319.1 hypothetical protein [Anaerocolumna cellulosilytica]BCJ96347.1 hypothetical protein acsn021_39160 [Anaerocolumna cellulosilytica]
MVEKSPTTKERGNVTTRFVVAESPANFQNGRKKSYQRIKVVVESPTIGRNQGF